jgi:hypothetical protein
MDSIGVGASAGDGKVDLTRSGVAQTTMASVEVLSGLSGDLGSSGGGGSSLGKGKVSGRSGGGGGKGVMGLFRRGASISGPSSAFGTKSSSPVQTRKRGQSEDGVVFANGHSHPHARAGGVERPLGFTSYRKPPGYVPSGSVLIQVWAVGVDGVDARLVLGGGGGSSSRAKEKEKTHAPYLNSGSGDAEPEPGLSRSTTPVPLLSGDPKEKQAPSTSSPKRSLSLRSTLGRFAGSHANVSGLANGGAGSSGHSSTGSSGSAGGGGSGGQLTPPAGVGYIPGRSFVGRVLECGWDVGDEVGKRGDWVVGLLDVKKVGYLSTRCSMDLTIPLLVRCPCRIHSH